MGPKGQHKDPCKKPAAAEPAVASDGKFGCAKRRKSPCGCLRCCPDKKAPYDAKPARSEQDIGGWPRTNSKGLPLPPTLLSHLLSILLPGILLVHKLAELHPVCLVVE